MRVFQLDAERSSGACARVAIRGGSRSAGADVVPRRWQSGALLDGAVNKLARKTRWSLYKFSAALVRGDTAKQRGDALKIESSVAALGGVDGGRKKLPGVSSPSPSSSVLRRWKYRERESRPVIAPL